ncbi:protein FLORAL ORGAN NUMBER2-like [Sorghum bicolor]|uniref:protein FLORAL ORGAN NUMBER2-like n=1 Tax=Sorghum bicolor TaxID=4558 RepID=UPI000B4264AE|nr:protein FLORAL ORGAN NUMBER2-like [Sorghum bicolor]|eukprot:XP_021317809.1 protein FLORAL ORGAN NUMBER2-like [Sorghum bicolor]
MARIFLCLLAAAYCCIALLPPPAQARRHGLQQQQAAGAGGRRRLHLSPQVPEPRFFVPKQAAAAERRGEPVSMKARPRAAAAWSVRPELRAVPGGPDPLHHHGGSPSRRPEQDRTPRSP